MDTVFFYTPCVLYNTTIGDIKLKKQLCFFPIFNVYIIYHFTILELYFNYLQSIYDDYFGN